MMEPRKAAVSSWVTGYMKIITTSASGMRCVRIGIVAMRQARVSRNVAPPRPAVAAQGAESWAVAP
jgi:hypothetical protein